MFQQTNSPIIGVYSASDWARQMFFKNAFENGLTIHAQDGQYSVSKLMKANELPELLGSSFNYLKFIATDENVAAFHSPKLFIQMSISSGQLTVQAHGEPAEVARLYKRLESKLEPVGASIEWIYNAQGHGIELPLQHREPPEGAYPWLGTGVDDYIEAYMNSSASVLILIGPPGTGKTSFIKHMIHMSKKTAKITYDMEVMSKDHFFAGFISDDSMFLIAEDADNFMAARAEGNNMMHRFLNVSDGLISSSNKKLVFSTNLPNIEEIDPALLRPGRCYDVLQFRPLTRAEAKVVADSMNVELPDGNEFTLAEIFNVQPSAAAGIQYKRRTIGFTR